MKQMEKSREVYEQIEIPKELEGKVQEAIEISRWKRKKALARGRRKKVYRWALGMAAAFTVVTMIGLNTSEAFAMEVQKIPVIGELARILTIRSYERTEGDIQIAAEIPGVDLGENGRELSEETNAQIEKMTAQYEREALERAEEYKQAFLETGGTEEEWAEHDIQIRVWYEIKNQTEDVLSFVVKGTENWTSAYAKTRYYNLDLERNEFLTLGDFLGQDYMEKANESIRRQIEERTQKGETFFATEEGGFETIEAEPDFYVNEKGNPVIVFEKYAIAPGAMGEVEFEIDLRQEGVEKESQEPVKAQETDDDLDNFDADMEEVSAFAALIKEAVAEKSLEKLADLTGFPVYVGLDEVGVVETKEDFLKLDPEEVLSEELQISIEKADTKDLEPSMAGFTLMDYQTEGSASITFGVVNGEFLITGINYAY
ncbi:MAG: DUF3298 domain-containing protein [Lachnospiraceae bacterium]|nr:DUF3298 domain-containing protein [Lachnospiraceae bacterium]